MKLLETWMQTPLAGALGFAVLHSFWEGAILAALLAIVLVATRSARARYGAACAAMLLLVLAFGITLLRMLPETTATARPPIVLSFPRWQAVNGAGPAGLSLPDLAAIVPWLAFLWITGVWIFYVRHLAAGYPCSVCDVAVFVARPTAGSGNSHAWPQHCAFGGLSSSWSLHWRTCPWCSAICVR